MDDRGEFGSTGSGPIRSNQDLDVWRVSMDLAVETYALAKSFPRDETWGLSLQVRRSATSVPANIAEGFGRGSRKDFVRFLRIAQGSLKETETHFLMAKRVGLLSEDETHHVMDLCDRVGRMLNRPITSLDRSP